MTNSAVKSSGGPTKKALSRNKKGEKKGLENQPSVDLRQPKEPDPYGAFIKAALPDLHHFKQFGAGTSELFEFAANSSDELEMGNKLLNQWLDDYEGQWNQSCSDFQCRFADDTGKFTCEERIDSLFKEHDGDWESVFRFLLTIVDIENIESVPDPFCWTMRCLAIQMSQHDPFSFFSINQIKYTESQHHHSLYWYQGDQVGLELRPFQMGGFWMMVQLIFDSPWTAPFNELLGTEDQVEFYSDVLVTEMEAAYATYENSKIVDDDMPIFRVPTAKTKKPAASVSPQQAPTGIVFGQSPSISARARLRSPAITPSRVADEDISDITGGTGIDKEGAQAAPRNPPTGVTSAQSQGSAPNNQSLASNQSGLLPLFDIQHHQSMAIESPPPNQRLNRLPPTIDEKMNFLTQMSMEGLPGISAHIFDINLEKQFDGAQSGDNDLTSFWVEHFTDSIYDALANSSHDLILLPIDDNNYKNRNLWIRSAEEVRARITTYRDVTMYADSNYGNFPYFLGNHSAGAKKLRTRIRVAYTLGLHKDIIKAYLHMGFRPQGPSTGCFDTPLQFCPIDKAGWYCFWPEDLNIRSFTKEIIRHLEWKYPIGLKWDWIAMPYVASHSKFNDKSPGVQQFHIYARRADVRMVDQACRAWLVPATPRAGLPWCFPCHYVHDWRSAQGGILSVRSHGRVRELVNTMSIKARDFMELTSVIYPSSTIHGLLRKTPTRNFGVTSLFKLLLHTKCTPAQAESAAAAHPPDQPEVPQVGVDAASFRKVARKRKKKKKTDDSRDPTDLTTMTLAELQEQMTPAQAKAYQDIERKRQKDLANNRPAGLIIGIVPGEFLGTYVIVIRNKFAPLGRNVFVGGFEAFLDHHLRELTATVTDVILKKWISSADVERRRRRNLIWDTTELRAREADAANGAVGKALEFLDGFGPDPMDVFDGTLEIDMNMIRERDIDNGATVAGALDEMREVETNLENAFLEIEIRDTQLELRDTQLAESNRARAELQAQLDAALGRSPPLPQPPQAQQLPLPSGSTLKEPPTYSTTSDSHQATSVTQDSTMNEPHQSEADEDDMEQSVELGNDEHDPMLEMDDDLKPAASVSHSDTGTTDVPAILNPPGGVAPSPSGSSISPWQRTLARNKLARAQANQTPTRPSPLDVALPEDDGPPPRLASAVTPTPSRQGPGSNQSSIASFLSPPKVQKQTAPIVSETTTVTSPTTATNIASENLASIASNAGSAPNADVTTNPDLDGCDSEDLGTEPNTEDSANKDGERTGSATTPTEDLDATEDDQVAGPMNEDHSPPGKPPNVTTANYYASLGIACSADETDDDDDDKSMDSVHPWHDAMANRPYPGQEEASVVTPTTTPPNSHPPVTSPPGKPKPTALKVPRKKVSMYVTRSSRQPGKPKKLKQVSIASNAAHSLPSRDSPPAAGAE